jgi:hypothetical protein
METTELHTYARQLWRARGPESIAEAAHMAIDLEKQGQKELAQRWRRIEAILLAMRGPRQS